MRHRSPFPRRFSPPRRRRSPIARKPTPAESPLVPPPLPSFSIPVAPVKDKDSKEAPQLQQKQFDGERKAEKEEPKKAQEESKKEQEEPRKDSAQGLKEEEPKVILNDLIQESIPIDHSAEDLTAPPPPTKEPIPPVKQSSPIPHRRSRRSPSSNPQPKQKSPNNRLQARPDSPQHRRSHRRTPSTHPPSPKPPSRSPSPATLAAHNRAAAQTSAELITTYKKRGHFDQVKKDLFSAFLESPIKAEFSADLKIAVNAELDRDPSLMARDRTKAAAMIERSADANGIYDRVEEFVDEIVKQRRTEIEGMAKALCVARNITPNAAAEIVKKQLMNGVDGDVGQDVDDEGDVVMMNHGS
ncbi:hypothetical protein EX30DRAFT_372193 [Ascodesmis nigricans]|uniref:BOD1/SHG1 domain-containing protein n=1 Tax=Ascodesmis nigricans TaxID=341454 RepID=A0A4S2MVK8_9PEZI|nr:hypothetical protein EX30DRAFT_372193 [Ascodesmis nigricans]